MLSDTVPRAVMDEIVADYRELRKVHERDRWLLAVAVHWLGGQMALDDEQCAELATLRPEIDRNEALLVVRSSVPTPLPGDDFLPSG